MAKRAPRLSDGIVILDGHEAPDIEPHLAGEDEEQARRFGWYPDHSTEESVRTAIETWQEHWRTGGQIRAFAIRSADSGELVGGCELRLQGDGIAHISYWVFPPGRRKKNATRAVGLASKYAFTHLGVDRIELYVEADNAASSGVARRAGFTREGLLRGRSRFGDERRDMVLHALLSGDLPTVGSEET